MTLNPELWELWHVPYYGYPTGACIGALSPVLSQAAPTVTEARSPFSLLDSSLAGLRPAIKPEALNPKRLSRKP